MLLIIGGIGLLATIGLYRKPDVKFFTPVTIFNRKEKLTETGSKVYLIFFILAVMGIVLKFTAHS